MRVCVYVVMYMYAYVDDAIKCGGVVKFPECMRVCVCVCVVMYAYQCGCVYMCMLECHAAIV